MQAPDTQAVRAVLAENFFGPISDDIIKRLTDEVAGVIGNESQLGRDVIEFDPANGGRGFGQRWREVLAFGQTTPRPLDLVAWVAFSRRGYPSALPNCPVDLCGSWQQTSPDRATWELRPDGTLRSSAAGFAHRTRWAVHRQDAPLADVLWVFEEGSKAPKPLRLRPAAAGQLALSPAGSEDVFVLERA